MDAAADTTAPSFVMPAPARPAGVFTLRRRSRERGDTLVEVIIAMGMLFTIITGFSGAYFKANNTMKVSVNETVADQAAAGFIEKARAAPWSSVGTDTQNTAQLPDPLKVVKGGSLPAVSTVTIRGLTVTLTTSIGWTQAPLDASAYGTKSLYIDASWQDHAGDPATAHTIRQEAILTPGVDQAAPSGVRGGA